VTVSLKQFCDHVLAQSAIITEWAKNPGAQDGTTVYRDLYSQEVAADAVAPAPVKADVKVRLKYLAAAANATPSGLSQATAGFGSAEYLAATANEQTYLTTNCHLVAGATPQGGCDCPLQ
jgi:hypothetical protein